MILNKLGSEVIPSVRRIQSAMTDVVEHIKPKTIIAKNKLAGMPESDVFVPESLRKITADNEFFKIIENYDDKNQLLSITREEYWGSGTYYAKRIFDPSLGHRKLVRMDFTSSNPDNFPARTTAIIDPDSGLCTELAHFDKDNKLVSKVSGIDQDGYVTYAEISGQAIAKYDEATNCTHWICAEPRYDGKTEFTRRGKINLCELDSQYHVIGLAPTELGGGSSNDIVSQVTHFINRKHY